MDFELISSTKVDNKNDDRNIQKWIVVFNDEEFEHEIQVFNDLDNGDVEFDTPEELEEKLGDFEKDEFFLFIVAAIGGATA